MVDCFLVCFDIRERRFDAFAHGLDRVVLFDQCVGGVDDDFLQQARDVLKVVVKGVAADVADVHNALDADFVQRSFVEQFDKRRLDGILGVIVRHPAPPFSETESDSIVPQNRPEINTFLFSSF